MQNGALAEARSAALLLERFWILDRSVDIEGADHIIQRRLSGRSLLDPSPPRLGYVQSKFYASEDTTQYIHREYVMTPEGEARSEFFLLAHTGEADAAELYFVPASLIAEDFTITGDGHSKPGRYSIPGRQLLGDTRYCVVDRRALLSSLEHALHAADFRSNRQFMTWALPSDGPAPVLEPFNEDLDNWWGERSDIHDRIERVRRVAAIAQGDLLDIVETLTEIQTTPDPRHAQDLAESVSYEYGEQAPLPRNLFDEDFLLALDQVAKVYDDLKQEGLLSAYKLLRERIEREVEAATRTQPTRDQIDRVKLGYDPDSLRLKSLRVDRAELVDDPPKPLKVSWGERPEVSGFEVARPGTIVFFFLASWYALAEPNRLPAMMRSMVCERIIELRSDSDS